MKRFAYEHDPIHPTSWLSSLKQRIRGVRQCAVLAMIEEQISLYHEIGRDILMRQEQQGWGAKVIDRLAVNLS